MLQLKMTLIFCFFFTVAFAQSDCETFIPEAEETTWEMSNYNAKDKLTGKSTMKVLSKEVEGQSIFYRIEQTLFDKKNKEIYTGDFNASCSNGIFSFDMSSKLDGGSLQAYKDMELTIDGSDYVLPSADASPGSSLSDGMLSISIGDLGLKMNVEIYDRKYAGKESVTTSAGTFDCIVITQNIKTKLIVNIEAKSKEWYAPNIGLVRSESYNKKGKLTGYSVLTKME